MQPNPDPLLLLLLLAVLLTAAPAALAMSSFPVLHPLSHISQQPGFPLQQRPGFYPEVSRRQMEVLPPQLQLQAAADKEPSCAELRSMWRQMRRMSRQMEFSNEIPKVPDPFVAASRHRPTKYPNPNPYAKSSTKSFHQGGKSSSYGKIVRDPSKVGGGGPRPLHLGFDEFDDYSDPGFEAKGERGPPGSFADFSLPEESLGVYGTVVDSPEEKARYRAQSRHPPSQFGLSNRNLYNNRPLWTAREGDTSGIGRVPYMAARTRGGHYNYGSLVTHGERAGGGKRLRSPAPLSAEYPQEIGQRSNGGARVERIDKIALAGKLKNSCLRLLNKPCRRDIDCFCNGSPRLFCGGDRCRPVFKAPKYGNQKWGGKSLTIYPYDQSFAGYGLKRDPSWPELY